MFNAFLHMVFLHGYSFIVARSRHQRIYSQTTYIFHSGERKERLFTLIYSMRGTVLEPVHKTDWLFAAALPECIGAKVESCRGLALTLRLPGIP